MIGPAVSRLVAEAMHVLNADPDIRARAARALAETRPMRVSDLPGWMQQLIGDAMRSALPEPAADGLEEKRRPWNPAQHPRDSRGRFTRFTPIGKGTPTAEQLAAVSDASLAHMVNDPAVAADGERLTVVLGELERRDKAAIDAARDKELAAAAAMSDADFAAAAQKAYLKRRGELDDEIDAAGLDPAELRPPERQNVTSMQKAREDWESWLNGQMLAAEDATRGNLLSPAGKAAGANPYDLFSGSASRTVRYASEELLNWFEEDDRRRMSFPEWWAAASDKRTASAARSRAAWVGSLKRWQDRSSGRNRRRRAG